MHRSWITALLISSLILSFDAKPQAQVAAPTPAPGVMLAPAIPAASTQVVSQAAAAARAAGHSSILAAINVGGALPQVVQLLDSATGKTIEKDLKTRPLVILIDSEGRTAGRYRSDELGLYKLNLDGQILDSAGTIYTILVRYEIDGKTRERQVGVDSLALKQRARGASRALLKVGIDTRSDSESLTFQSEDEAERLLNQGDIEQALALLESSYSNLSVFSSTELRLRVTYNYARALKGSVELGFGNLEKARSLYKSLESSYRDSRERILGIFERSFSIAARRVGLTMKKIREALVDLDVYETELRYNEFVGELNQGNYINAYDRFKDAAEIIRRNPAAVLAKTDISHERVRSDLEYLDSNVSMMLKSLNASLDGVTLEPSTSESRVLEQRAAATYPLRSLPRARCGPRASVRAEPVHFDDPELAKAYLYLQMQIGASALVGIRGGGVSSSEYKLGCEILAQIERCAERPEDCARELIEVGIAEVTQAVRAKLQMNLAALGRQIGSAIAEIGFMRAYERTAGHGG